MNFQTSKNNFIKGLSGLDFTDDLLSNNLIKSDMTKEQYDKFLAEDKDLAEFRINFPKFERFEKFKQKIESIYPNDFEFVERLLVHFRKSTINLFINKFYAKNNIVRKDMLNLPSSSNIRNKLAAKRFSGMDLSETEFKDLAEKTPIFLDYDHIKKQSKENTFVILVNTNKYFIEYIFYLETKELFRKKSSGKYWPDFIAFMGMAHQFFFHEFFLKEIDWSYENKLTIEHQLIKWRKSLNRKVPEIIQFWGCHF